MTSPVRNKRWSCGGNFSQHGITEHVTVGIINLFEIIEINNHH